MRIFVDQRDFRLATQHRLDVEFGERSLSVRDVLRWNDFDALDELADLFAAMCLDDRGDDLGSAFLPAMCLAEHGAGLADTRCCP